MLLPHARNIFAALMPAAQCAHAANAIAVVADEWPPFSGADLPNGGMSLDVISSVLGRAGYDVRTEVLPWACIRQRHRSET